MKRPIIALDFASRQEIGVFLDKFPAGDSLFVKVGMELFYQEGPEIVHWLRAQGHDVFLDLKLHDIPNTVASAMKGIAKLGVKMTNVHAAGGEQMMRAALTGLIAGTKSGAQRPILLAVTQLTSTSEKEMQQQQLIPVSLVDSVTNYAQLSQRSGLDGVVCSALEVGAIKQATTKHFSCLTPGIRPRGSEVGDQKRVVTPEQAHQIGSDYIVVGRPITQSATPYEQYQQILREWNGD